MPLAGYSGLPVAARDTPWDGPAARRRILERCAGDITCISRAFLWRDPDADPATAAAWSLGIADVIDGTVRIVPRAVAVAAGRRGVDAASMSVADKARAKTRVCALYRRIQQFHADWPECPFQPAAAITAAADGDAWEGIVAYEGETTGDGRRIRRGAITWGEGPWPLVFDAEEMDHTGRTIGTVDEIVREGQAIRARGHLSDSQDPATQADVQRARELLAEGAVGVSLSYDAVEMEEAAGEIMVMTAGRVRSLAIVDEAAFDRARIALVASVPTKPDWFANPRFGFGATAMDDDGGDERLVWQEPERPEEEPQFGCPFTVAPDRRVYGHVTLWGRCHVGSPGTCVRPPREPAAYRGYLSGERVLGVATGPLIMGTTHARVLGISNEEAMRHYADTGFAVADITIGPDAYGIWAAGAVRPGVTDEQIECLRASTVSADWRVFGAAHRLIGVLVVNAGGFRTHRAHALAASGALITYGPAGCETCKPCGESASVEDRVAFLEDSLTAIQARLADV